MNTKRSATWGGGGCSLEFDNKCGFSLHTHSLSCFIFGIHVGYNGWTRELVRVGVGCRNGYDARCLVVWSFWLILSSRGEEFFERMGVCGGGLMVFRLGSTGQGYAGVGFLCFSSLFLLTLNEYITILRCYWERSLCVKFRGIVRPPASWIYIHT